MLRFLSKTDRLPDFPLSATRTVILLVRKIHRTIASSTDLTHQLVRLPG
jgi:hypothetical protein